VFVIRTSVLSANLDGRLLSVNEAIRGEEPTVRTQVAIIGAGPAGLVLAALLRVEGIDTVVVEAKDRRYIESRVRAGLLEQATVDLLDELGVSDRLHREALVHDGIELLADGVAHRIDMAALTGRRVSIYGQQEVVKDLVADRLEADLPLLLETTCTVIDGFDGDHPVVHVIGPDGVSDTIECEIVVGADGFHGVSREMLAPGAIHSYNLEHPFGWLGILASAAPASGELIYAQHPHGFALASMRSPQVTRLYVQCGPDDDVAQWPDSRVWDELHLRLAREGWSLNEGEVLEKGITAMRSFVAEPLRHGRLFLAGDAAHIVPPTGAKGMNLAIADVAVLAPAITAWLRDRDERLANAYSDTALERVWRAQNFSTMMTAMMHRHDDEFENRRQRAALRTLVGSQAASRALAESYVGLPLPGR
jgi:p-hydroxybenzoate 3-monooxygenase